MQHEELLSRIAAGDEKSFRELYDLMHVKIYNTCLVYLQNTIDAEEALQDVFVEVYHSAAKFNGKAAVQTWIYRIAINKCLDRLRYKKRIKRFAFVSSLFHSETGALMHDEPDFLHPGIALENKEKSAELFKAMKKLPENQHSAFVLKYIEGLPQKEIAVIMDVTEKAVEALLQRAKATLRAILGAFYNQMKE